MSSWVQTWTRSPLLLYTPTDWSTQTDGAAKLHDLCLPAWLWLFSCCFASLSGLCLCCQFGSFCIFLHPFGALKVARLTFKKAVYSRAGSWGIFFRHPWFLPDEKQGDYINASHCTHPSSLERLYSFSPPEVKRNHHLVMLTPRHVGSFPLFPTRGSPGCLELQFSQLHLASPPLSSQSNTRGEVCPVIIDMFHTERGDEGERQERGRMGRDGGWMWAVLVCSEIAGTHMSKVRCYFNLIFTAVCMRLI